MTDQDFVTPTCRPFLQAYRPTSTYKHDSPCLLSRISCTMQQALKQHQQSPLVYPACNTHAYDFGAAAAVA